MKALYIIAGILVGLTGVYGVMRPGMIFLQMTWLFGSVLVFAGISGIITYFTKKKEFHLNIWHLLKSIITLLIGVIVVAKPGFSDVMLGYMFAFWLCSTGTLQIIATYQIRKAGGKGTTWSIVLGVLQVIIGILAAARPLISILAMGMMVGMSFISYGITLVYTGIGMKKVD